MRRAILVLAAAVACVLLAPTVHADPDAGAPAPQAPLSAAERTQLRWCAGEAINKHDGDGQPDPLGSFECLQLIARALCLVPPDRSVATKFGRALEKTIAAPTTGASLVMQESLDEQAGESARITVRILRCHESALSGKELAEVQALESRATKWAADMDRATAAERAARDNVVSWVCQSDLMLEQARAALVHEKANPSGVVDLHLLHSLGGDVQYAQERLAALAPQYQAVRHHPFAGWRTEGECIARRREAAQ